MHVQFNIEIDQNHTYKCGMKFSFSYSAKLEMNSSFNVDIYA
jgi:hypothetical protein